MRSVITVLVLVIFFAQFASAEIIISQQPIEVYNFGDVLDTSITLTTSKGIYDDLQISLICNNYEAILHVEQISLFANNELTIEKSIFLIKRFIGESGGSCKIKASLEDSSQDSVFSNEFEISNSLNIESRIEEKDFEPGDNILINGNVTKKNEKPVTGFVNFTLMLPDLSEYGSYQGTIIGGDFSINIPIPNDAKAGNYFIKVEAYEEDPLGETTNTGITGHDIFIKQVPTSLEILFENQDVEPGTDLKVKAILYDQTGEKINSSVIITVKDKTNKILEQVEIFTGEFFEFPIAYNEPPAQWTIIGLSNKMSSESHFEIIEKQDVQVDVINNTLILRNIGNVFYNSSLMIKFGDESIRIDLELEVDEVKKYSLKAPDGEYVLEIIVDEKSKLTENVVLTGKSISVKEISDFGILFETPIVWIFVILILGSVSYVLYRKGFKKTFFGRINFGKIKDKDKKIFGKTSTLINPKNKAELSLSIRGEKQNSSLVCLKLKNFEDIKKEAESTKETFGKIINLVEENKAYTYENHDNLFFILAPAITRTFNNEMKAIGIAQKIEEILKKHNKLFKQKIDFGISISCGEIIVKKEKNVLKFMSFGNFMADAKKISRISKGEIYLSKKFREKIISRVKTEKFEKAGVDVYTIKEIKKGRAEHKKFLEQFIKRLEEKKPDDKKKD